MDRIRTGVVGLRFGQQHVRTLANMEDARIVAVAGSPQGLPGGLETYAAHYGAKAYRDGLEMLEREKLDAVSLCVSPAHREKLIESAASKGIALLVEKPWAADLAQARHLAAICQRHNATVMVAFSFRFLPAIVRLRELIDGPLGTAWMLNGEYVFDWLPPPGFWLWDAENGGGFLNENSCHLFDSVCYLLGDPISVAAEAASFKGSPSEEVAAITLSFAGGAIAALTVGCLGAGAHHDYPRLDVVTANGQAHLAGRDHIWERLTWALRGSDETQTLTAAPERLGHTRYTRAMQHFLDCVRNGQKPSATIEDGIRSVAIAQAVYESAHSGHKVQLSL